MAIVMNMRWDGVTPEQYDALRTQVGWEQHAPEGGRLHVASFADGALCVTDIWDSADDFNRFAELRLMPVVQEIGIQGEPAVTIAPLHAVWNPGVERGIASPV
jgi:hypothetical protein